MQETQFYARPGTQDEVVAREVLRDNSYRLISHIPNNKTIIDIGANIGAFALACLLRGANGVVCFEPDNECFKVLMQNTALWQNKVVLHNAALWRKDEPAVYMAREGYTAQGAVIPQRLCRIRTISVPTTDLDSVIESVSDANGGRVALLKIDAEGAEYPVLYTSTLLSRVDEIVGETHDYTKMSLIPDALTNEQVHGFPTAQCNIGGMTAFLQSQGFAVHSVPECGDNEINNLFWAYRTSSPERICQP